MKKILLITSVVLINLLITGSLSAQGTRGESVINIGAGYSLFGNLSSAGTNSNQTSTPVISGTYDYFIVNRFSYGLGISYQGFAVKNSYAYYNNPPIYYTNNVYLTNVGIRALYNFGTDILNGYAGVRLGYSFWRDQGNINNPSGYPAYNDPGNTNLPSFQVLVGLRASITSAVAVHIEVGLGTPYVAETGISFRFGNGAPQPPPTAPPPAKQF